MHSFQLNRRCPFWDHAKQAIVSWNFMRCIFKFRHFLFQRYFYLVGIIVAWLVILIQHFDFDGRELCIGLYMTSIVQFVRCGFFGGCCCCFNGISGPFICLLNANAHSTTESFNVCHTPLNSPCVCVFVCARRLRFFSLSSNRYACDSFSITVFAGNWVNS